MLVRCGCDVVSLDSFQKHLERSQERLLARIFSPTEIALCRGNLATYAAFFAGKEALAKALGCGLWAKEGLSFFDVEIRKTAAGAPYYIWSERLSQLARQLTYPTGPRGELVQGLSLQAANVSLSHDGGMAMATAVVTLE